MANLTADEIQRLKDAFVTNDKDGTLTERVKNLVNNNTGVFGVTYTIAAEGSNEIIVSCQFTDTDGDDMAVPCVVWQYLASDTAGLVRVAATTSLAVGTDGLILNELVSNSLWIANSEADGDLDIIVGDVSGAATYYLVTVLPNGLLDISAAITFA